MDKSKKVQGISFFMIAFHWFRLLWPFGLTVGGGWLLFGDAIVGTIHSTEHPVLVYGIFAAALIAVVASIFAMQTYLREASLAVHWLSYTDEQKEHLLASKSAKYCFAPVLSLLIPGAVRSGGDQHALINAEIEIAQEQLDSRLELPNFIGGALVGLGLVGTFVGLLSTLDDLSHVFSALVNSGDSTATPTQMFSDMVAKLQAPMKGMGTAFVASLYGLMGSLMITMMLVGANKTSAYCSRQYFLLVRRLNYGYTKTSTTSDFLQTLPGQRDDLGSQKQFFYDSQVLREAIDKLSEQVKQDRSRQESWSRQSGEMVMQMISMVKALSEQQGQLQQQLHVDLDHVRAVLQAEHSNMRNALHASKRDSFETIKAIEACRQSFESGARNLRVVLNNLPVPDSNDDSGAPILGR